MDITIVMLDGTSHTLKVQPQDTVGSLKVRIEEKFKVPRQMQKLVLANGHKTPLSDDLTPVSRYGLQNGSQVSLLVTQPATIQVFLRNLEGKTSTYDVKPDETVSNFKTRVQHREGLPVSQQRLIYQDRELMGGKLSDYNVEALGTINLNSRLRGG